jgi:hypothetical protein
MAPIANASSVCFGCVKFVHSFVSHKPKMMSKRIDEKGRRFDKLSCGCRGSCCRATRPKNYLSLWVPHKDGFGFARAMGEALRECVSSVEACS